VENNKGSVLVKIQLKHTCPLGAVVALKNEISGSK
jgi:hypothetical protein